jgi:hypothetical protein
MAAVGLVQTESGLRRVHFAALSGRLAHMMLSSCLHTLLFQPKKLRLNNCKDFKKKLQDLFAESLRRSSGSLGAPAPTHLTFHPSSSRGGGGARWCRWVVRPPPSGGDGSTPVQVLVGIFVAGGLEDIGGWVATGVARQQRRGRGRRVRAICLPAWWNHARNWVLE